MRILFSVFLEDFDTRIKQLCFSDIVETELTLSKVDEHLQIYDHFHSNLEVGMDLAFWDIYCFNDEALEVVDRIKTIPAGTSAISLMKDPKIIEIQEYDPGNTDSAVYPDTKDILFFTLSRYECGASGFSATIAYIVSKPLLIGLAINFTYDICKMAVKKFRSVFLRKKDTAKREKSSKTYYFRARRFYRNFTRTTNIDQSNCQIVYLKRIKGEKYKVVVRTTSKEIFEVNAGCTGKIYGIALTDASKVRKH